MARIRTIKPDFFISETVSALSFRARLTWIGLWTHCDDYGRTRNNVKLIKAAVWPLDNVSLRDVDEDLSELEKHGLLFKYEVDGRDYLQITSWTEHQKVDRPSKTAFPGPDEGSRVARDTLASRREPLAQEGKGRERKGGDAREPREPLASAPPEPSPRCPEHTEEQAPGPCGACGDARRAHERWTKDAAARTSAARAEVARQRAEAVRLAIDACGQCDDRGYLAGALCAHDPSLHDRAVRGAAAARAQIKPGPAARPTRPGEARADPFAALDAKLAELAPADSPST